MINLRNIRTAELTTMNGAQALLVRGKERIDKKSIPRGVFAYEIQSDPFGFGIPEIATRYVNADRVATVLCLSPLPVDEESRCYHIHGNDLKTNGRKMPVIEYLGLRAVGGI